MIAPRSARIPAYDTTREAGRPFDPAPALRFRPGEGPVTRVRLWDGSTPWLVTGHAEYRAVIGDPRVSADPANGTPRLSPAEAVMAEGTGSAAAVPSFLMMDDPEHARLRRMVTGAFTVKRVATMRSAVQRIVDGRVDALLAGPKPADLVEVFAMAVPSLVICELLGVPYADHDFFQATSAVLINRGTTAGQRAEGFARLAAYLDGLIGEKVAAPADDLLSGLVGRIDAGELSRAEAVAMAVLVLFAGHETTANMIALGTVALLEHPDQLALLRDADDPAAVASAVEELSRYLTITHGGLRRVATADIEVAGRTIRAGEGIVLVSEAANRDPAVFPDPDRLDLRRDARRHVAFGHGVHQCVGQPLARLELQVAFPTLLRRVPTLRRAVEPDRIPFKHDGFVFGVHELPVTW
ncbi:MAG: cytochrome P450 [Saccharothrix sp.]|nr:cytochrome P450 [Saccharothrix sp.]